MGNPTFGSTGEGSAITPFNTDGFVAAFDTNIHVASGSMEIGLDFEEDSPPNMGQQVIAQYPGSSAAQLAQRDLQRLP